MTRPLADITLPELLFELTQRSNVRVTTGRTHGGRTHWNVTVLEDAETHKPDDGESKDRGKITVTLPRPI